MSNTNNTHPSEQVQQYIRYQNIIGWCGRALILSLILSSWGIITNLYVNVYTMIIIMGVLMLVSLRKDSARKAIDDGPALSLHETLLVDRVAHAGFYQTVRA